MYGDDYKSKNPERYNMLEELFEKCANRYELAQFTLTIAVDKSIPREDIHVLHKRTCIKKGWEE